MNDLDKFVFFGFMSCLMISHIYQLSFFENIGLSFLLFGMGYYTKIFFKISKDISKLKD